MFGRVAAHGADLVLMHMLGQPRTMQEDPQYVDVVAEVRDYLLQRAEAALAAGIPRGKLWIDPGIGFGKTLAHNLALLRALEEFVGTGYRVLLGASRKSFIGDLTEQPDPRQRLSGSLACVLRALEAGVQAVRVHDVRATRDALTVYSRIR
jgi:dihydropteroate synthase